jgi:hypothetical protein
VLKIEDIQSLIFGLVLTGYRRLLGKERQDAAIIATNTVFLKKVDYLDLKNPFGIMDLWENRRRHTEQRFHAGGSP